jgi:molybdopterin molybdotransferase
MDGYAVRAPVRAETRLSVIKEGQAVHQGEALRVRNGDILPEGSNAIAPVEWVRSASPGEIIVLRDVKPFYGVRRRGSDVRKGEALLHAGEAVLPTQVKLLSEAGVDSLMVARTPRLAVVPVGDEFLYNGVPEVTGISVVHLLENLGVEPNYIEPVPDEGREIVEKVCEVVQRHDGVILIGGSGKSWKDISWNSKPVEGVEECFHGVRIRPGKGTSLYLYKGKPVMILPGFQVAAYTATLLVVSALINKLLGRRVTPLLKPVRFVRLLNSFKLIRGYLNVVFLKGKSFMSAEVLGTEGPSLASLAKADLITVKGPMFSELRTGEEVAGFSLMPTVFDYIPSS